MTPNDQRPDSALDVALTDTLLKQAVLTTFKTVDLCSQIVSPRIEHAHELAKWGLKIARRDYDKNPERLMLLISPSSVANALAVWGSSKSDWIVLSDGLLLALQSKANQVAEKLASEQSWILETELLRSIQKVDTLTGLDTPVASFLYFAAVSFFVGHEAGHHVLGHDGYFRNGAHAEVSDQNSTPNVDSKLTKQALEFQADRYGVMVARVAMIGWLSRHWDVREYSAQERASYQWIIAFVMSVGALMALSVIKPRRIDWEAAYGREHPPGVLRMIQLLNALTESIKENFGLLGDKELETIRLEAIDLVAETTLVPGSPDHILFRDRLAREGRRAALRAIGLLQAIHDPNAASYIQKIANTFHEVTPLLNPRSRRFIEDLGVAPQ
ncbi:hypothetical protein [Paraburkholderia sp. 40]|uniref:hypothetical protein n=1 Tax=Paraburkholderia sp. 40 TaxID=2991059 RepID=UPI003D214A04